MQIYNSFPKYLKNTCTLQEIVDESTVQEEITPESNISETEEMIENEVIENEVVENEVVENEVIDTDISGLIENTTTPEPQQQQPSVQEPANKQYYEGYEVKGSISIPKTGINYVILEKVRNTSELSIIIIGEIFLICSLIVLICIYNIMKHVKNLCRNFLCVIMFSMSIIMIYSCHIVYRIYQKIRN